MTVRMNRPPEDWPALCEDLRMAIDSVEVTGSNVLGRAAEPHEVKAYLDAVVTLQTLVREYQLFHHNHIVPNI
jgi:hypothetical protein